MRSPAILIVDDDQGVRQLLATALALSGFSVLAAAGGPEALTLLGHAVDLVLTDFMMPGMDGIELAAEIRKLRPRVPIILMSGGVSDIDPALAPLCRFVRKPLNVPSLIGVIRDELAKMARPAQSQSEGAATQHEVERAS